MKYDQIKDRTWHPLPARLMCCDCGLVHDSEVRINGKHIEVRLTRNNRSTAAARRKKKK